MEQKLTKEYVQSLQVMQSGRTLPNEASGSIFPFDFVDRLDEANKQWIRQDVTNDRFSVAPVLDPAPVISNGEKFGHWFTL